MTSTPALAHFVLAATSSKRVRARSLTLLPLLAIGVLGYFFFIRPQQRKAQAARQAQGSGIEVGDEVQTVGGVIGTVLEIHGDRYTLLTGALGRRRQPRRPPADPDRLRPPGHRPQDRADRGRAASTTSPVEDVATGSDRRRRRRGDDIDDVGGDGAPSSGEQGGEAEEA